LIMKAKRKFNKASIKTILIIIILNNNTEKFMKIKFKSI